MPAWFLRGGSAIYLLQSHLCSGVVVPEQSAEREGAAGVYPAARGCACCRGWGGQGRLASESPSPFSLCSHVDTKELCGRCPALWFRSGVWWREMRLGTAVGDTRWDWWEGPGAGAESSCDP